MHDETTPPPGLRLLTGAGIVLVLIGALWLALLGFERFKPGTLVAQAERDLALLPSDIGETEPGEPDTATIESGADTGTSLDPGTPSDAESASDPSSPAEPGDSYAPSDPIAAVLTPRLLIDSDLGTGSSEFSAVALNEDTNRLLIAEDAGLIFEFELDDAGLPITPHRRTIRVSVGAGDIEGLSWIQDELYVIAHEDDGVLTVVTIDDVVTELTDEHLQRTVDTQIREENGNGLEGVATVRTSGDVEFVVVDERPPTVYWIDTAGDVVRSESSAFDVTDLSDIYVSPQGVHSAISDEDKVVIDFTIDQAGLVTIQSQLELTFRGGDFEQPEGLVRSSDGSRLYVVGEAPGPGNFAFGFWSNK